MKTKNGTRAVVQFDGVNQTTPVNLMNLSAASLRRAAKLKDRITGLEKRFNRLLSLKSEKTVLRPVKPVRAERPATAPKRHMSVKVRRKISRAHKRMWKARKLQEA